MSQSSIALGLIRVKLGDIKTFIYDNNFELLFVTEEILSMYDFYTDVFREL